MATSNTNKNLLQVSFFLPQFKKGKTVSFPAFITNLADNFTSNWSAKQAYGFQDQIGVFIGTNRTVSIGLRIVAASVQDAADYQKQLNKIAMSLYPTYDKAGIPQSSPILGIKVHNMIHDNGGYLFGWLNGISLAPNLSEGSFLNLGAEAKRAPMLPNLWDISFELNVIHRKRPGFGDPTNSSFNSSEFPVKVASKQIIDISTGPAPPNQASANNPVGPNSTG
tara:strand:+ start:118 stop:786 length:669 start_codon:yes stop_codon:yes gene_type:complete